MHTGKTVYEAEHEEFKSHGVYCIVHPDFLDSPFQLILVNDSLHLVSPMDTTFNPNVRTIWTTKNPAYLKEWFTGKVDSPYYSGNKSMLKIREFIFKPAYST